MKTAISVPDGLFAEVERLVRRSGRPRSEMYSTALREYVARHAPDGVTEALDGAVEQLGDAALEHRFSDVAARRVLATTEW
ncbi:MAG: ribbon-helix-helix protein, CopG family [Candidatus Limnocylindria bacterium]